MSNGLENCSIEVTRLTLYVGDCFPVCEPGYFLNSMNGGNCEACPVGMTNDVYNSSSCTMCPNGETTLGNATVSQDHCG